MNEDQPNITQKVSGSDHHVSHAGPLVALTAGLVLALAGDGYLIHRSNDLNDQLTQVKQDAQSEVAKLSDTTTALLEQERQQSRTARACAGGELSEFPDIGAGDERSPSPDQHRCANRGIVADLSDCLGYTLRHAGAQRVHRRILDGDDCYLAVPGELNKIAHRDWMPFREFLRAQHRGGTGIDDQPRDALAMKGRVPE